MELRFDKMEFVAPAGEFDAPKEIAEQLLTNDAIQKVGADTVEKTVNATTSVERKIRIKNR